MNFKIGDKVTWCDMKGGKIIGIEDGHYAIEWKKPVGGHTCKGLGKDGHCYWGDEGATILERTNVWKGKRR